MSRILKVTLKKSLIGQNEANRRTAIALGLKKIGQSTEHEACPNIMGMIRRVAHLIQVEEVEPRDNT
jgi:large subunit ribosomal protein L30